MTSRGRNRARARARNRAAPGAAPGLDVVEQLGDAGVRTGADDAVDLRERAPAAARRSAAPGTRRRSSCCPRRLCAACSRIVSVDSAFAGSMKAHVLMTTASASRASASSSQPAAPSLAIITSVSTRFLAQPKLTNATDFMHARIATGSSRTAAAVRTRAPASDGDDLLQIVFVLAGDANLLVLILRGHLEFERS